MKPPENPQELSKLVAPLGAPLKDLEKLLELELAGERRRYVVQRVAQRINSLRSSIFYNEVMQKLGD